jgi:hypothetical protein
MAAAAAAAGKAAPRIQTGSRSFGNYPAVKPAKKIHNYILAMLEISYCFVLMRL